MRSTLYSLLLPLYLSTSTFAQKTLLLRPARVFDGETMHENWSVRVKNDRIDAVGPTASLAAVPTDSGIDLPGATLLPGLIEGHSHLLLHPYNETPWDDQVLREAGQCGWRGPRFMR